MYYCFIVEGIEAAPQGSKRHVGNARMIESSKKVKPWREAVRLEANKNVGEIIQEPVHVELVFWFMRPKSHLNAKGETRQSAPRFPTSKNRGDIDKLCRSTLDALTLSAFADDSQVVSLQARKYYCDNKKPGPKKPGAMITIQSTDRVYETNLMGALP